MDMSTTNITFRQQRRHSMSELEISTLLQNSAQNCSYIQDESMRSVQDVSLLCNNSRIIDLEIQNEELRQNVIRANQEISNLSLDNINLRKENESYKVMTNSLKTDYVTRKHKSDKDTRTAKKQKASIKNKCSKLHKKIRTLNRKLMKLSKRLEKLQKENIHLQEKVQRYDQINLVEQTRKGTTKSQTIEGLEKNTCESKMNRIINIASKKIMIFSDNIGRGLANSVMDSSEATEVFNYCKPGADSSTILENFKEKTKKLSNNDLALILISQCDGNKNKMSEYIKTLKNIVSDHTRKFNIAIGSLVYNRINNEYIYRTNEEICRLVRLSKNSSFIDLNTVSRMYRKTYLREEIIHMTKSFRRASTLNFIECSGQTIEKQEKCNTIFQTTQQITAIG